MGKLLPSISGCCSAVRSRGVFPLCQHKRDPEGLFSLPGRRHQDGHHYLSRPPAVEVPRIQDPHRGMKRVSLLVMWAPLLPPSLQQRPCMFHLGVTSLSLPLMISRWILFPWPGYGPGLALLPLNEAQAGQFVASAAGSLPAERRGRLCPKWPAEGSLVCQLSSRPASAFPIPEHPGLDSTLPPTSETPLGAPVW